MSNPESFIEEVTEEVRRDRLFALFRKYGWIGVVLILCLVGGAAYNEWQKAKTKSEAQAFGETLLSALDQTTPADRRAALQGAGAAASGNPDQAALQQLLLASDPAEDRAAALAALEAVAADQSVSEIYRDLATLRRVILAGKDLDISVRRAALDPIAIPGRAFRTLALEQMAYLSVEAGEVDAAITQLRALSSDQEAPAGLRQRASQMIVALGGESAAG